MPRFHCPHCQHILELVNPARAHLCPACQQWCRIPVPEEFEMETEEVRDIVEVREPPTIARPLGHAEPERVSITDSLPDDKPLRFRADEEVEHVEFEVVESGDEPPRRRKRRRRRRRAGEGIDLDWISLPLILLVVLAPGALLLSVLAFLIHPVAGIGCMLMMGGGTWFTLIAAEDGLVQALLVMCVPFYAFYYAFMNWERVAIPFLLQIVGWLVFTVSMMAAAMRAANDRWSDIPAPSYSRSSQQFADGCAPRHQHEWTPQPIR